MRRLQSFCLIAALILASCASEPPSVDWCYIYDFTVSADYVNFISGEWVNGVGLVTDDTDELVFNYTEDFFIHPEYVTVRAARGADAGDIQVDAIGTVFGLSIAFNETLPSIVDDVELTFEQDDPNIDGASVNVTLQTDGEIVITEIEVGGFGFSPFPSNPCGPPTATPTDTLTATEGGPTATSTPSATFTPSITPTPDPYSCDGETLDGYDWMECFPLALYPAGWTGATNSPGINMDWIAGTGWSYGEVWSVTAGVITQRTRQVVIDQDWASLATFQFGKMKVIFSYTAGCSGGNNTQCASGGTGSVPNTFTSGGLTTGSIFSFSGSTNIPAPQEYVWTGTANLTGGLRVTNRVCRVQVNYPSQAALCDGDSKMHKIVVWGNGAEPDWDTDTPPTATPTVNTPTPTPSLTLTPSLTPTRTPLPGAGTATATRTPSWTPLPGVMSPTPFTPTITNTPAPTLPPPTAPPSSTFVPLPTALPSQTIEATYEVPGLTGIPNSTLVGTAGPVSTFAPVTGHSDVYNFLATAVVEVNNLPGDMGPYVPDPNIAPLLGYAKWFLSCTTAQEMVGQNVGLMLCHSAVGLSLIVILSAVVMSVRIITLVLKFAMWIFKKIIDLIPFI